MKFMQMQCDKYTAQTEVNIYLSIYIYIYEYRKMQLILDLLILR